MDLAKIDSNIESKMKAIEKLRVCSSSTNKQLEDDRRSVLQTSSIDPLFRQLTSATAYIHVGWLLSPAGKQICRILAIRLDSHEPGWENLATELGLTLEYIRDIKFNRNLDEGPTYTVLCIYAYKDDATVDKVLEALHHMKRYDILSELKQYITGEKGLIEILQSEAERWHNNEYGGNELNRISSDAVHAFSIKPKLPPVPIKYQLFSTPVVAKMRNFSENMDERPLCTERMLRHSIKPEEDHIIAKKPTKKRDYRAIVMLTFSVDGFSCAKNIASALRKQRIGVLILDEHRDRLISNPELFITGLFPQVNYVIPIVTRGYLDALVAASFTQGPLTSCADTHYVKLIYTLMANQYLKNGCINFNVRCIVPEGSELLLQEHPVACNRPVLQAWLPESDVDVLAQSILSMTEPASEE